MKVKNKQKKRLGRYAQVSHPEGLSQGLCAKTCPLYFYLLTCNCPIGFTIFKVGVYVPLCVCACVCVYTHTHICMCTNIVCLRKLSNSGRRMKTQILLISSFLVLALN